ncbi:transposase [Pseudomonas sp. EpS/L25]
MLGSGAKWRDLPERYGPWTTVYPRFRQWRHDAGPSSASWRVCA